MRMPSNGLCSINLDAGAEIYIYEIGTVFGLCDGLRH